MVGGGDGEAVRAAWSCVGLGALSTGLPGLGRPNWGTACLPVRWRHCQCSLPSKAQSGIRELDPCSDHLLLVCRKIVSIVGEC